MRFLIVFKERIAVVRDTLTVHALSSSDRREVVTDKTSFFYPFPTIFLPVLHLAGIRVLFISEHLVSFL